MGGPEMPCSRHSWPLLSFSFSIAFGQGTGYWHTSGNRILDQNNAQVRIAGINWYGFENEQRSRRRPVRAGLQRHSPHRTNLRASTPSALPFSSQVIEQPSASPNIQFSNQAGPINADLRGLNSLEVMDKIVAYAGQLGLEGHPRSSPFR